ncbi:MAG: carbohydrate kinase family protein [Promethearchaeota archaeon]|jgi:ribokinase
MEKIEIIGLGEVVIDWVTKLPHFPKPDEKIDAISENYFSGGVTANYLVCISRLGVSCGFIGAVGDDSYGRFLVKDFKKEKVDTKFTLLKKGFKTPVNFVFICNGEKTIIQSPHMHKTKLSISDLQEDYIAQSKILHTTIIHPKITQEAIKIAKKYDIKISIDLEPQIAQRGWKNLKKTLLCADVLIPNKEGAKMITKCDRPEESAQELVNRGIPLVIITLGDKGALITTEVSQKIIPTFEINDVVDTTGAGDTFNGAFSVAYWIRKWDLEKSVKYANAAAALKIQKLGARTGMPLHSEIEEFLAENICQFED